MIPAIDISPWISSPGEEDSIESAKDAVAKKWDEVLSQYGFAIIIRHGLSSSLIQNIDTDINNFFTGVSRDVKMTHNHGAYGHPEGGYTPTGLESVIMSNSYPDGISIERKGSSDSKISAGYGEADSIIDSVAASSSSSDPVESFVFPFAPRLYNPAKLNAQSQPVPFPTAQQYFNAMESLLKVLHRISSRALGLPDDEYLNRFYYFDDNKVEDGDGSQQADSGHRRRGLTDAERNGNALRLAYYVPYTISISSMNCDGGTSAATSGSRYGEHTDYQGFTILRPDPADWREVPIQSRDMDSGLLRYQRGGLEVRLKDTGEWVPVVLPQDNTSSTDRGSFALVVNAGDLIQRWTNDRWHSAVHRVSGGRLVKTAVVSADASVGANGATRCTEMKSLSLDATSECLLTTCDGDGDGDGSDIQVHLPARKAVVFFSGPRDNTLISMLPMRPVANTTTKTKKRKAAQQQQHQHQREGNDDKEPLDDEKQEEEEVSKYPPIRSGDHLLLKLKRTQV
jgi:isopenicillin N synthase-like dioxygenase